jgi:hypothetical protein
MVFGGTQISSRPDAGYLRVTCHGDFPSQPYRDMLLAIRDGATRAGRSRILVDAFAVGAPAREFDRFWFGSAVAELFHGGEFKVALLVSSDPVDKLGEDTAVNRGARLLVVGDEEAALAWLMG